MHDLPTGPTLSALARNVLLEELLPLLPRERQLEARLVAAAMAIAEREAVTGALPSQRIGSALERLYEPPFGGTKENRHPEPAQSAGSKDAHTLIQPKESSKLWRRFAADLRHGAFAGDEERSPAARDIMWRLTLAKLRLANPRFLAANGFSEEPR